MPLTISADVVRMIPLFSGVPEQDKETLLSGGYVRQCARGDMLFAHGEPVTHFYIIISGMIRLFRTSPDGKEKTINVLTMGQTLCESEIFDVCRSHRVNAMPVEESAVIEFPIEWFKDAIRQHSHVALNLFSLIAHQAHMAEIEAEHQATMSAAQLVACFLQRLCVLYDLNLHDFELPYSKTLIASRLGMELETFSRAVTKLKEYGMSVRGTSVAIHDVKRLGGYVCSSCSVSGECEAYHSLHRRQDYIILHAEGMKIQKF
ncbi:MAG: Crp/Fnr family transcriptional regulator [Alphaproteobacteria bacterium]|nr:Crp/Fnr family transcriptional regulator [Alphaproteobacteria bacterium]